MLAPRGIEVCQPVPVRYVWRHPLLAVDPLSGTLRWARLERMAQANPRPVPDRWGPGVIVQDGAGAHRGKTLRDLPTTRVLPPLYSPELNPVERVFEEIRRQVEGRRYDSLRAKQDAIEHYLSASAVDPHRAQRPCGWDWLRDALAQPSQQPAS